MEIPEGTPQRAGIRPSAVREALKGRREKGGTHQLRSNDDAMRNPALVGLVDALRRIHAARAAGEAGAPSTLGGLQPSDGRAPGNGSPERRDAPAVDPSSLPDALGELLFRAARLHVPPRPEMPGAALYEALRQRIREAEAATLERHTAIDRMLDRAGNGGTDAAAPTALVQETVYLQCARGGRTAGRFRCINRADAEVRARIRPGAATVPGGGPIEGVAITVSPHECTLGPGAPAIITVAIDLQRSAAVAGDRIESCVDVELDGACALKVWMAIDLYDPAP